MTTVRLNGIVGILAATVVIAVLSAIVVTAFRQELANAATARQAVSLANRALIAQLDEETGIRGYVATRDRSMLEPYNHAVAIMPGILNDLDAHLRDLRAEDARSTLAKMRRLNETWIRTIATAATRDGRASMQRQRDGKALIDNFRRQNALVLTRMDARLHVIRGQTDMFVAVFILAALAGTFGFGIVMVIFGRRERSYLAALEPSDVVVVATDGLTKANVRGDLAIVAVTIGDMQQNSADGSHERAKSRNSLALRRLQPRLCVGSVTLTDWAAKKAG